MQNRSIRNVPWYPTTGGGQVVAFTDLAEGLSAAMTVGREHCVSVKDADAWVRVGTGAAANDFPILIGEVFVYTPTKLGVDDTLSFLSINAGETGDAYIGQSERNV